MSSQKLIRLKLSIPSLGINTANLAKGSRPFATLYNQLLKSTQLSPTLNKSKSHKNGEVIKTGNFGKFTNYNVAISGNSLSNPGVHRFISTSLTYLLQKRMSLQRGNNSLLLPNIQYFGWLEKKSAYKGTTENVKQIKGHRRVTNGFLMKILLDNGTEIWERSSFLRTTHPFQYYSYVKRFPELRLEKKLLRKRVVSNDVVIKIKSGTNNN